MSEEKPFEGYTPEFQLYNLSLMYNDPKFLEMVVGVVEPEHFDEKIDSVFAEIFLDYGKHFKDPISKEVVVAELRKLKAKKKIEEEDLPNYIARFAKGIMPIPKAAGWIKKEVQDFVCSKSLEVELVNSVDLLKKKEFGQIVTRIQTAYDKATNVTDSRPRVSLRKSRKERVKRYADPDAMSKIRGHSTGIREVDEILYAKGVAPGEMIVYCGSPGRGKSIILMNSAVQGMLDGENTLFYTLEVARSIVEARTDACLTGVPVVELYSGASTIEERWDLVEARKSLGEIDIVDLPPRTLTPNMIRRDLRRYATEGKIIHRVVVDYADIMASDRKIDERRLEHGDVYEQLRGVAKEFQVSMWTASQANRDSLRKADVDLDSLSEDFSKAMTADFVIGLSQTKTEEGERIDGRGTGAMRLFFGKNRNGKKAVTVRLMTDFTRMRMSMEDWDETDGWFYGAPTFRLPVAA